MAEVDEKVTLDGDVKEQVAKLSLLVDVLSSAEGLQEAVIVGIRCEWRKFKDIESVLRERVMSLKLRGSMYIML